MQSVHDATTSLCKKKITYIAVTVQTLNPLTGIFQWHLVPQNKCQPHIVFFPFTSPFPISSHSQVSVHYNWTLPGFQIYSTLECILEHNTVHHIMMQHVNSYRSTQCTGARNEGLHTIWFLFLKIANNQLVALTSLFLGVLATSLTCSSYLQFSASRTHKPLPHIPSLLYSFPAFPEFPFHEISQWILISDLASKVIHFVTSHVVALSTGLLHLLRALIWGDSCYGAVGVVRTYRERTGRLTLSHCDCSGEVSLECRKAHRQGYRSLPQFVQPKTEHHPQLSHNPFLIALPSDTASRHLPTVSCNNNEAKGTLLVAQCDISDRLAYLHMSSKTRPHVGWP